GWAGKLLRREFALLFDATLSRRASAFYFLTLHRLVRTVPVLSISKLTFCPSRLAGRALRAALAVCFAIGGSVCVAVPEDKLAMSKRVLPQSMAPCCRPGP